MSSQYRQFLTYALCTIAVAACLLSSAKAQGDPGITPLFASDDVLNVRIEAPITTLMRERNNEREQDALLSTTAAAIGEQTYDVKIRLRGNHRARDDNCKFAPLRLNFRKKQVKGTVFEGQDKLKLVTHCLNAGRPYEQSMLMEFVAYRILNRLTDLSYRVRLLQVDYVDTDQKNKSRTKYAFLIESDDELARRAGMPLAQIRFTTEERLDPRQTALYSVFQYLIGNTDFSPLRGAAGEVCCHNTVLLENGDGTRQPVPYDFDLSGLVDAQYASPNPELKISSVRQRLYRGYCRHNDWLDDAIALTVRNREAIRQLIENQEQLMRGAKRKAQRYIDTFYDRMADERGAERYLIKECS